jgi:hypothetical protein
MVGQNDVSTIAYKQAAIDFYASLAQSRDFLEQSDGVKHHAISDYAAAARAQNSTGNQLKNKFFPVDNYGVSGIVAAGVTSDDQEILGENVDNLAFTFVTLKASSVLKDCGYAPLFRSHTLHARREHSKIEFQGFTGA